jgi:hypothetical protein
MRALNPRGHTFYVFFYLRPNPEKACRPTVLRQMELSTINSD